MAFTVKVSLDVEASPAVAFETLADHGSWSRWMPPGFVPVDPPLGALRVGLETRVRIARLPFPSELLVTVVEPSRQITWGGGLGRALRGEHSFLFEETPRGTHVISSEVWSGWLSSALKPLLRALAARIGRMQLEGLRKEAEARQRS